MAIESYVYICDIFHEYSGNNIFLLDTNAHDIFANN
jgi:hypothetical protein